VLQEDYTLLHLEYLHTETSDPRLLLVHSLLNHIADTGSVVVYNAMFERGVLKSLADAFPEYMSPIQSIMDRLWDQLAIFTQYSLHPDFLGSNSIKQVLPVLVPALSYQELDVQHGDEAQAGWERMLHAPDTPKTCQMSEGVSACCPMETAAMGEMHGVLRRI
jgi:hypothetical protein